MNIVLRQFIIRRDYLYWGINGYYPLEPDKEFELSLPSDVLMKVKQYIENIISEDSYEIQKMTLCQKVKYVDVEKK